MHNSYVFDFNIDFDNDVHGKHDLQIRAEANLVSTTPLVVTVAFKEVTDEHIHRVKCFKTAYVACHRNAVEYFSTTTKEYPVSKPSALAGLDFLWKKQTS